MVNRSTNNDKTIVAIGDSLTRWRNDVTADGATPIQTYVSLIARARGISNWTNSGINGNTTTQMKDRRVTDVLAHRPRYVIGMGWTNDQTTNITGVYPALTWAGGGIDLATTKSNLKLIVQDSQNIGAEVLLVSPPPIRYEPYLSHSPQYITMMQEIAAETSCSFIDNYTAVNSLSAGAQDNLYCAADLLGHWSWKGHAFFRDNFIQVANNHIFAS